MASPVVVVTSVPRRAGRFGRGVRLADAGSPAVRDGARLCAVVPSGEKERVYLLEHGAREAGDPKYREAAFYQVATGGFAVELRWARLGAGQDAAPVDLVVSARLRVVDAGAFLLSVARSRCGEGVPFDAALVASWLADAMRHEVLEELRRYSVDTLLQKDPLPDRWWRQALERRVGGLGLVVDGVGSVVWSSPDAEAARLAEEQRRHLASVEQLQRVERDAELARARTEAEQRRALQELALDATRQQALEVRQKVELAKAEAEWERERRAAEVEALQHERRVAELRQDAAEVARVQERQDRAKAASESRGAAFARLASLPADVWRDLTGADAATRHASAERLVAEHGVGASLLAWLGLGVSSQLLLQYLREKAQGDGRSVAVEKPDLVTRTIRTQAVQAVVVNASLQLFVSSRRAGFLTLLNLGTSGDLFLHVPNAYVGPDQARVEAGRRYQVPGPELLPWEALRAAGLDYLEAGPPGWEHMVAVVSDEPLIEAGALLTATSTSPLVEVGYERLFDVLGGCPEDSWSVGVLSFLVE